MPCPRGVPRRIRDHDSVVQAQGGCAAGEGATCFGGVDAPIAGNFVRIALQAGIMDADIETLKVLLLFRCSNALSVGRIPLVTAVFRNRLESFPLSPLAVRYLPRASSGTCVWNGSGGRLPGHDDGAIRDDLLDGERPYLDRVDHAMEAAAAAVARGFLPVLRWLFSFGNGVFTCSDRAVQFAAAGGHLATVCWVHETGFDRPALRCLDSSNGERIFNGLDMAAADGHTAVVQWLHSCGHRGSPDAVGSVAATGNLQLLAWMINHAGYQGTEHMMDGAAINGHLAVCKWIFRNCPQRCSPNAVVRIVDKDNLIVLRWLRDTGILDSIIDYIPWRINCFGRLATIKWLFTHTPVIYTAADMAGLAGQGRLDALVWLHDLTADSVFAPQAVVEATPHGDLATVRWLHAMFGHESGVWTIDLTELVLSRGHWHIAAFLKHKGVRFRSVDL
ncbi:hypothetical protein PC119_g14272 [Phytophthora cactorum]|nr:hypothetical protein PC119_g14272 [Phytophthora cactorum]